jgi:hypothetical protein
VRPGLLPGHLILPNFGRHQLVTTASPADGGRIHFLPLS